ncbi:hypothetical protein B4119_3536 [Parageobacillus caldoxylosilyticus]|uniref:Uncharacterized protein n=1 Tax=Saccharococcus caldoxylosilyticus TaxID=81408 RepID=A0A150L680_9BACL|nr:hypothetical protein B4119_3536 [Parageobacillus caldoxylosilyticus]
MEVNEMKMKTQRKLQRTFKFKNIGGYVPWKPLPFAPYV